MQPVFRGRLLPYLMLSPTLVILGLFLYWPALRTFWLSLTREPIRPDLPAKFIWFENFETLFHDPTYWGAILFTLWLSIGVVILSLGLALAIALLGLQRVRGGNLYRALLIWPYGLSPAVAGIIFLLMFKEVFGLIYWGTELLLGVEIQWLSSTALAPFAILIAAVWRILGFNVLFYMAALQNLPKEVLESATIDGAGAWRRFWAITFPLLSPMTLFLTVTTLTYSMFDLFGLIHIMTRGGPSYATTNLVYRIYSDAFLFSGKGGVAAAQSLILFTLVAGITILQIRSTRKLVHYGA